MKSIYELDGQGVNFRTFTITTCDENKEEIVVGKDDTISFDSIGT